MIWGSEPPFFIKMSIIADVRDWAAVKKLRPKLLILPTRGVTFASDPTFINRSFHVNGDKISQRQKIITETTTQISKHL